MLQIRKIAELYGRESVPRYPVAVGAVHVFCLAHQFSNNQCGGDIDVYEEICAVSVRIVGRRTLRNAPTFKAMCTVGHRPVVHNHRTDGGIPVTGEEVLNPFSREYPEGS